MSSIDLVQASFAASIATKSKAVNELAAVIVKASEMMVHSLKSGGKILSCGNGGSACDAMHFTAEILNRFQMERDGLPAYALTADTATLTAIANDYSYEEVFARQIKALGHPGDILLAISTSGNSKNILRAVLAAQQNHMHVVALTGNSGGALKNMLQSQDLNICVTATSTPRIQETHILVIHCLCEIIDKLFFS